MKFYNVVHIGAWPGSYQDVGVKPYRRRNVVSKPSLIHCSVSVSYHASFCLSCWCLFPSRRSRLFAVGVGEIARRVSAWKISNVGREGTSRGKHVSPHQDSSSKIARYHRALCRWRNQSLSRLRRSTSTVRCPFRGIRTGPVRRRNGFSSSWRTPPWCHSRGATPNRLWSQACWESK